MKKITAEIMVDDKEQPQFATWAELALILQLKERIRQNVLWGDNHFAKHSKHKILTILMEEVGEIARAILDGDQDNLLEEAVQSAAVCQAFVELLLKEQMEGALNEISTNYSSVGSIPCSNS